MNLLMAMAAGILNMTGGSLIGLISKQTLVETLSNAMSFQEARHEYIAYIRHSGLSPGRKYNASSSSSFSYT
jgi:hypothetical protein